MNATSEFQKFVANEQIEEWSVKMIITILYDPAEINFSMIAKENTWNRFGKYWIPNIIWLLLTENN